MKVTQVVELSKSRSKVYIEQEFAFVLYKGELRLYHVKEGEELSEEDFRAITEELLPRRAKRRAMNLLTKRDYTTAQLRKKLAEGFYPQESIDQAISYVESFHYTDDLRYATDYITYHEQSKSRQRILQDLTAKGISAEILEKAWNQWEEQGGLQDESAMVKKLLEKKQYDPMQTDYKERQRIYGWLMRKGFPTDVIQKALRITEN